MNRFLRAIRFAAISLSLCGGVASAQKPPRYPVEQYALPNGLRVALSVDRSVPLVGVAVGYHVGSRNETLGKTGFAHLFEHMMFQGSAQVGLNEFARYIETNGGSYNGTTYSEVTTYESIVPAQKLPLVLWMEADRMRSLAVTAANFQNQKDVVKEEKRLRLDNQPYAAARAAMQKAIYTNFANQHLPIGSMFDLDNASLEYVQFFYKTYYCPNNAVLAITGNFDIPTAKSLIEKYFGGLERRPAPPKPDVTEKPATKMRTAEITDPFATIPAVCLGWAAPSLGDPDYEAMDLLFPLVFQQESTRADADIGAGEQWVYGFAGGLEDNRGPNIFSLRAIHRPSIKAETIRDEIMTQIVRLQSEAPTKEELERVRASYMANLYRAELEPLADRAVNLVQYMLKVGEAVEFYNKMDRLLAVTPQQIQEVAKKYLRPDVMTYVEVKAKERKEDDE